MTKLQIRHTNLRCKLAGQKSSAWVDLLKARAIENSCYTFGVNRVGRDGNQVYYDGQSVFV